MHLSQVYLAELIQEAVRSCPSAHNSQSTCIVILMGDAHHHFWNIVKEVQRKLGSVENYRELIKLAHN